MAIDLLALLLEATLLTTAAVIAVWLLRGPWRRLFGVRAAILVWLVVPLAALLALAPDRMVEDSETLTITIPFDGWLPVHEPATLAAPDSAGVLPFLAEFVLLCWIVGAMAMLGLLAIRQRRFRSALGRLSAGGGRLWVSERRDIGPLVLGAISPKVIVPPDFAERFDTRQRRLMLAHEYAHLRRGDPAWNLVSAAFRCLFWFNPLIHLAANRFRRDQELACDARVLEFRRRSHRSYAAALLALAHNDQSYPALTFGPHPLKERIMQISTMKRVPPYRRRVGALAALMMGAGLAAAAWAVTPATEGALDVVSEEESSEFFAFDVEVTVGDQKGVGSLSLTGERVQVMHPGADPILLARDTLTINYDEEEPGWRAEVSISRHGQEQVFVQAEVWQDGLLKRTPSMLMGKEASAHIEISGSESGGQDFRLKLTPVSQDRISALTTPLSVDEAHDEAAAKSASRSDQDQATGRQMNQGVVPLIGNGIPSGLDCGQAPCAVRMCDGAECSVVGFYSGEKYELGSVPNADYLTKAMVDDFIANLAAKE